jgi:hypothetical protein
MLRLTLTLIALIAVALFATPAAADATADHAALADAATKLSANAASLAKIAKESDDRGARKKFGPAAQDLSDDLAAFARRAAKDQPFKALASDAAALVKDSTALVELADEAEDKDTRKALRAHAVLIQTGVANMGKQLVAASQAEDKGGGGGAKPAEARRFTGLLVNNSDNDKCSDTFAENVFFQVVSNGQAIWKSQLVFPGKNTALALHEGQYVIQILGSASNLIAQRPFDAKAEGWQFNTGCVDNK